MNVPKEWLKVLQHFKTDNVMIAGGAMRDLDNGVTPKDIDVWVFGGEEFIDVMPSLPQGWEIDPTEYSEFESATPGGNKVDFVAMFNVEGLAHPVNVVVMKTLKYADDVLDSFDFDICRIGVNKNGLVQRSPRYELDKAARTFTYDPAAIGANFARSAMRWERLSEKYPGWSVVGLPAIETFNFEALDID